MEADLIVFRSASNAPVMDPRVAERLDAILAGHACFSAERQAHPKRRNHHKRGGRQGPRGFHGGQLSGAGFMRGVRSMPTIITGGGTSSERTIRSDLNKLAPGNYGSVARRLRLIADIDNLTFTFRTALEKAYLEPEHNSLYINLFMDILESLGAEAREVAIDIVRGDLPTDIVIRTEALRPVTDPAKNYDEFCDACRIKRRIVGRSSTFASLLGIPSVSGALSATPLDVFCAHERVMKDLVSDADAAADPGVDATGAVEIMLESLGSVIGKHNSLRDNFRTSIDEMTLASFPSPKCRFKIMDILGR